MSHLTKLPQAAGMLSQRSLNAVVVSAGLMQKTVKVRVGQEVWNRHIRKTFHKSRHILVHDPNSSLHTGDIVTIVPGHRVSKAVHHVVSKIIAPYGPPIEERPPVPTPEEFERERARKKMEKDERKGKLGARERRLGRDRLLEEALMTSLGSEDADAKPASGKRQAYLRKTIGVRKAKASIEEQILENEGLEEMRTGIQELDLSLKDHEISLR